MNSDMETSDVEVTPAARQPIISPPLLPPTPASTTGQDKFARSIEDVRAIFKCLPPQDMEEDRLIVKSDLVKCISAARALVLTGGTLPVVLAAVGKWIDAGADAGHPLTELESEVDGMSDTTDPEREAPQKEPTPPPQDVTRSAPGQSEAKGAPGPSGSRGKGNIPVKPKRQVASMTAKPWNEPKKPRRQSARLNQVMVREQGGEARQIDLRWELEDAETSHVSGGKANQTVEPSILVGDESEHWCSLCADGGTVVVCDQSECRRVVCVDCIPELASITDDMVFVCPACTQFEMPYYGLYHPGDDRRPVHPNGVATNLKANRGHKSRVDTSPLCVIEVRVENLPAVGTPARVLNAMMEASYTFPGAVLTVEYVEFNIGSMSQREKHQAAMAAMVKRISRIPHERIVLFINTHSDNRHGTLFCGQDCGVPVDQFLEYVVTLPLLQYMGKVPYSAVWMLACGHLVDHAEQFDMYRTAIQTHRITDAFAFAAKSLLPYFTVPFVLGWASHVLIDGWKTHDIIGQLLISSILGRHTNVYHLTGTTTAEHGWQLQTREYIWSNPTLRPHGKYLPLMCPQCQSYRSMYLVGRKDNSIGPLIFVCKARQAGGNDRCLHRIIVDPPTDVTQMRAPPLDTWLVRNI